MAIAHGATTRFPTTGDGDTTTGTRTFTHTPAATPAGVAITILHNSAADPVTGVQYGGVGLTLTQDVIDTGTAADQGRTQVWTLTDQTIPSGTQTVTLLGCSGTAKLVVCATATSATDLTTVNNSNGVFVSAGTNPTVSVTTSADTMLYGGWHSGAGTNGSTAASGTTEIASTLYGANSGRICRSSAVRSAGTNSLDYTFATSDNYDFAVVALAEKAAEKNVFPDAASATAASNVPTISTSQPGPAGEVTVTSAANNATISTLKDVTAGEAGSASTANNATVTTTGGGEAPAENALAAGLVGVSSREVKVSAKAA